MLTILLFVLVLSSLIFIHEFGHFWTARKLGVMVEEFGFGFPPRLFGVKRRSGTIYSINLIPFGGFVRLKGEQGTTDPHDQSSFASTSLGRRSVIVGSGVVMNFLLTVVLFIIGFSAGAPTLVRETLPGARISEPRVFIRTVLDPSPAHTAGFRGGEILRTINGQPVTAADDVLRTIQTTTNPELIVTFDRRGDEQSATVTPTVLDDSGVKKIGIDVESVATVSYPIHWAIINGLRSAGETAVEVVVSFSNLIKDLIVHQRVSPDVAGPVGIAVLTGQVAQLGVLAFIQFVALLSLSLAVINVLPFPGLDGGRLFFFLIERIRGRPFPQRTEAIIHNIGFALLLLFILSVSIQDVQRFNIGERVGDAFRSIFH